MISLLRPSLLLLLSVTFLASVARAQSDDYGPPFPTMGLRFLSSQMVEPSHTTAGLLAMQQTKTSPMFTQSLTSTRSQLTAKLCFVTR